MMMTMMTMATSLLLYDNRLSEEPAATGNGTRS